MTLGIYFLIVGWLVLTFFATASSYVIFSMQIRNWWWNVSRVGEKLEKYPGEKYPGHQNPDKHLKLSFLRNRLTAQRL